MKDESNSFLKRYQLLLILVILLLVIGFGCWFIKKRDPNYNEARKDDLLRKLNQPVK